VHDTRFALANSVDLRLAQQIRGAIEDEHISSTASLNAISARFSSGSRRTDNATAKRRARLVDRVQFDYRSTAKLLG
jgi:hypothetical protein